MAAIIGSKVNEKALSPAYIRVCEHLKEAGNADSGGRLGIRCIFEIGFNLLSIHTI